MSLHDFLVSEGILFHTDEPMNKHTSFRIGGQADYYIMPADEQQLFAVLQAVKHYGLPFFAAGNLSNVVFDDAGYRGAVISTENMKNMTCDGCELICEGGVSLSAAANEACRASLSGLEFAYGIPGTVGGAVYMNAGAYGGQMSGAVSRVRYVNCSNLEVAEIGAEKCAFGYRTSVFERMPSVILSARLRLHPAEKSEIKEKMNQNLQCRKEKQPLEYPSAGSVFKRPEGRFVGPMIEDLGLKGLSVGGAAVSQKHAGFIINQGGATCSDLKRLIAVIQEKVHDAYGIDLECEIKFVES